MKSPRINQLILLLLRMSPHIDLTQPKHADHLLVQGRLFNRGGFRQPYPELSLEFFDIQQQQIAQFDFLPEEYLGDRVDPALGMGPGESVPMTVEIEDPGATAINYEFGFR